MNRRSFLKGIVGLAALLVWPKAGVAQLVEPRVAGSSPAASPSINDMSDVVEFSAGWSFDRRTGILTIHENQTVRNMEFIGVKKIVMEKRSTMISNKIILDHRHGMMVAGQHTIFANNVISYSPKSAPTSGKLFACCDNYVQCAVHAAMTRS